MAKRDQETTKTGKNRAERSDARARLLVLAGRDVGRRFTLGASATIGRSSSAEVILDDDEVSRQHLRISCREDGRFFAADLGSRNGTLVDGVRLTGEIEVVLGSKIQLGTTTVLQLDAVDALQEQALQRQRLEVLGRLGAGVAHDLNNMLSVVLATVDYLRALEPERVDDHVRSCLDDIDAAASRAAQLTPRFVAFARSDRSDHAVTDVSELCSEVARLCERTFPRAIRFETDIARDLRVTGHAGELHQVVMNLCINARDAMPRGGTLTLRAYRHGGDGADDRAPLRRGDIVVSVADDGAGIPDETLGQIFSAFFSTKRDSSSGYGLGLATVKDVAEGHGGLVLVESEVGKGSTFRLHLPRASNYSRRVETHGYQRSLATEDFTLLLVDDEPLVRRSAARQLKSAGYRVLETNGGREAVEVYASHVPRPDLVLLDLDMPDMTGEETLRALMSINPEVMAIAVSGHDDPARARAILSQGAHAFVHKPWRVEELESTVAQVLSTLQASEKKFG